MKLIFAGTPEFAAVALDALLAAGHQIPLVLTQPDRPAGRGLKMQASAVKQRAQSQGLRVEQPRSLRLDGKYPDDARAAQQAIAEADAEAMVVAAYGLILPQWVLDALAQPHAGPRRRWGCLNIHASLLPRWRGAAPIQRAIEAGDAQTGVTIMQMDAGLDTGDMLLAEALSIAATDSCSQLHDRLAAQGGRLIVQALTALQAQALPATPQPAAGVCYAAKIEKSEAAIDWQWPAALIERRIRAFDPFPGASTSLNGESLKIWQAELDQPASTHAHRPGQVLAADALGVQVACGPDGRQQLRLLQLQRAGSKRLAAADFLRGCPLSPGQQLGTHEAS
jgi:methionyl-tRNA formyltransferase